MLLKDQFVQTLVLIFVESFYELMVGGEDQGEILNQTHYEDLLMTRVFRRRWTLLI